MEQLETGVSCPGKIDQGKIPRAQVNTIKNEKEREILKIERFNIKGTLKQILKFIRHLSKIKLQDSPPHNSSQL